jgi:hypothetical protein
MARRVRSLSESSARVGREAAAHALELMRVGGRLLCAERLASRLELEHVRVRERKALAEVIEAALARDPQASGKIDGP